MQIHRIPAVYAITFLHSFKFRRFVVFQCPEIILEAVIKPTLITEDTPPDIIAVCDWSTSAVTLRTSRNIKPKPCGRSKTFSALKTQGPKAPSVWVSFMLVCCTQDCAHSALVVVCVHCSCSLTLTDMYISVPFPDCYYEIRPPICPVTITTYPQTHHFLAVRQHCSYVVLYNTRFSQTASILKQNEGTKDGNRSTHGSFFWGSACSVMWQTVVKVLNNEVGRKSVVKVCELLQSANPKTSLYGLELFKTPIL